MPKLLKEMMSDYFTSLDNSAPQVDMLGGLMPRHGDLPVKPSTCSWEVVSDPKRFHKKFEFQSHKAYSEFVEEVLEYEEETGHYGKLVCEYPSIVIEVYTHDVDSITESDQAYIKAVDEIFEDVQYYGISSGSAYEY